MEGILRDVSSGMGGQEDLEDLDELQLDDMYRTPRLSANVESKRIAHSEAWPENDPMHVVIAQAEALPISTDPGYIRAEEDIRKFYVEFETLIGDHPAPKPPEIPVAASISMPVEQPKERGRRKCASADATERRKKLKQAQQYEAALPGNRTYLRPYSAGTPDIRRASVGGSIRQSAFETDAVSRVIGKVANDERPAAYHNSLIYPNLLSHEWGTPYWRSKSSLASSCSPSGPSTRPSSGRSVTKTLSRPQSAKGKNSGRSAVNSAPTTRPSTAESKAKPPRIQRSTLVNRVQQKLERELETLSHSPSLEAQLFPSGGLVMSKIVDAERNFRDPYRDLQHHSLAHVPLEAYDDLELETNAPEEWLNLGRQQGLKGTPAFSRYFFNSERDWEWLPCYAIDYDRDRELYLIEWAPNGPRKLVKRLNLVFESENREKFYARIEAAILARSQAVEEAAYMKLVDQQDNSTVPTLSGLFKRAILERVGRIVPLNQLKTVDTCMDEIERDFIFSMKRANLELQAGRPLVERTNIRIERFAKTAMAESNAISDDPQGNVVRNVAAACSDLSTYMFNANVDIQKTITQVLAALRAVLPDQSLYKTDMTFPTAFMTFKVRTEAHINAVTARLIFDWPRRICEVMEPTRAYFNYSETNKKAYEISRLKSFLRLVGKIMESQLKEFLLDGLKTFLSLFAVRVVYQDPPVGDGRQYTIYSPPATQTLVPVLFTLHITAREAAGNTVLPTRTIETFDVGGQSGVVLEPPLHVVEETIRALFLLPEIKSGRAIPHIETTTMTHMYLDTPLIVSLHDEPVIGDGLSIMRGILRNPCSSISELVDDYAKYDFLLQETLAEEFWEELSMDLEEMEKHLRRFFEASKRIAFISPPSMEFAPFLIDCSMIRKIFELRVKQLLENFRIRISDRLTNACDFLQTAYSDLYANVIIDPGQDAASWKTLKTAVDTCMEHIANLDPQLKEAKAIWQLMYDYELPLDDTLNSLYWTSLEWPLKLTEEMERAKERLEEARNRILNQIIIDREYVMSSIAAYFEEIKIFFGPVHDVERYRDMVKHVRRMRARINRVKVIGDSIPIRAQRIGVAPTPLTDLRELEEQFGYYESLWSLVDNVRSSIAAWMETYFADLDAQGIVANINQWADTTQLLLSIFQNHPGPSNVTSKIREEVSEFDRFTTVLTSLRNPALRAKHWIELSKIVGITLHDISSLKLRQVMNLDLELVADIIQDISTLASSESDFDDELDAMRADLLAKYFIIQTYVSAEYHNIQNFRELQVALEDLLIRSERLAAKASSESSKAKLETWMKRLNRSQETLEAWQSLQSSFTRIYPILELSRKADELTREQADNFGAITKLMAILSDIVLKNRQLNTLVVKADLHEMILGGLARVPIVWEGVMKLIDEKRKAFGRFYFLDNDEILAMVSTVPDVTNINRHLVKCFDGIESLILRESGPKLPGGVGQTIGASVNTVASIPMGRKRRTSTFKPSSLSTARKSEQKRSYLLTDSNTIEVIGAQSFDGERILFREPIIVSPDVEKWLAQLARKLTQTVQEQITAAMNDARSSDLSQLVLNYSTQVSVVIANIFWNQKMQAIAMDDNATTLQEYRQSLEKERDSLVQLNTRYRTPSERIAVENAISALSCAIEVTTGDVSTNSNDWNSRITYDVNEQGTILIRQMHYSMRYGYEYLPGVRLSLTPITSRTLNCMMNAMQYASSVMLNGPGAQEETLKELSRIVGVRCVVLDCSEGWSPGLIERALCGLLATPQCWLCLHSIDKVPPKVLSSVGQIISTVHRNFTMALKTRRSLTFDKKEFTVGEHTAIFATISAGRKMAELPITVRTLFRNVSVALPDPQPVLDILLRSKGFRRAPGLAKKGVTLIGTLSEMCAIHHFSLETLRKITNLASVLRSKSAGAEESVLAKAFHCMFMPGLRTENERLFFKNALHQAFDEEGHMRSLPPNSLDLTLESGLAQAVASIAASLHITLSESFIRKLGQLHAALSHNTMALIVGKAYSGKSTLWKLLERAIKSAEDDGTSKSLQVHTCFPSAVDESKTGELLSRILSETIDMHESHESRTDKPPGGSELDDVGRAWIVLDGEWSMGSIQSACSGNSLFNASGKAIHIPKSLRLIQETDSLSCASPSMIAAAAIIFVDGKDFGVKEVLETSLTRLSSDFQAHHAFIKTALHRIMVPVLDFMRTLRSLISSTSILSRHAVELLSCILDETTLGGFHRLTRPEQHNFLLAMSIFSVSSVVASFPDVATRLKVDSIIKSHLTAIVPELERMFELEKETFDPAMNLPEESTLYDIWFDIRAMCWRPWRKLIVERDIAVGGPDILITNDAIRISYFVRLLTSQGYKPLVIGRPGVGKTTCVQAALHVKHLMNIKGFPILISQSNVSNAEMLRHRISKRLMEKRKNVLGCPSGQTAVIFVDDVSDDTRLSEFWRTLVECGGWYGGKNGTEWQTVEDIKIIHSMSWSGRKQSSPHERFLRHFLPITLDDDAFAKLTDIASCLFENSLSKVVGPGYIANFVKATWQLFSSVQSWFRPTPNIPHYTFNMKDAVAVLKIVAAEALNELPATALIHVWGYACHRNFADRLTDDTDRQKYYDLFEGSVGDVFPGVEYRDVFTYDDPVMYMPRSSSRLQSSSISPWKAVRSLTELSHQLSSNPPTLSDLSPEGSNSVLDVDGVTTILSLCSKLRIGCHSIMMGHRPEDHYGIARLAAWICGLTFIDASSEKDVGSSLSNAARTAIYEQKAAILYVEFDQIKEDPDFLAFLKWGTSKHLESLVTDATTIQALKDRRESQTPGIVDDSSVTYLLKRMIHVVISWDAIVVGPGCLSLEVSQFPALLRTCAIQYVGKSSMTTVEYLVGQVIPDDLRDWMKPVAKAMHVVANSGLISSSARMHGLDAVRGCFRTILQSKRTTTRNKMRALGESFSHLRKALDEIRGIEELYRMWQEKLDLISAQTRDRLKDIENETELSDKVKTDISKESDSLQKLGLELKNVQHVYASEIGKVAPALSAAQKAVESIPRSDIFEIKSMINPPKGVQILCEALLALLARDVKSPNETIWEAAKKLLSDKFLLTISRFDIERVTMPQILRVEGCLKHPDFRITDLEKISKALGSFAKWLIAVEEYYKVSVSLQPTKLELSQLTTKARDKEKQLSNSKERSAELESKLVAMRSDFDAKAREKASVESQYKEAERKHRESLHLKETLRMIESNWSNELEALHHRDAVLLSECLLATWTICYLGCYPLSVRRTAWREWKEILRTEGFPINDPTNTEFSLCDFIYDSRVEDFFISSGSIPDRHSFDNALIAKYAPRYSLLFDPHGRLQSWVQTAEKSRQSEIVEGNDSDDNISKKLIPAMRKGQPVVVRLGYYHMGPFLSKVLLQRRRATMRKRAIFEIVYNGDRIVVEPSFQLYFILNRDLEDIPDDLYPIQAPLEFETITELLFDLILDAEQPKLRERKQELDIENLQRRNKLKALSAKAQEFVGKLQCTDLYGGTLYGNVLSIEDQTKAILKSALSIGQLEKDISVHLEWYRSVGYSSARFCGIFLRFRKVAPVHQMSLARLLELCKQALLPLPENDTVRLAVARRALVNSLYRAVSNGMRQSDRILFAFLLASELASQEGDENKSYHITEEQWKFLVDPDSLPYPKKEAGDLPSNLAQWLKLPNWGRIIRLGNFSQFRKFPQDFQRYANRATTPVDEQSWEDVFRSPEPWSARFPGKWNAALGIVDKLLVLRCLRADAVCQCMMEYVSRVLGDDFLETDPFAVEQAMERAESGLHVLYLNPVDDPIVMTRALSPKTSMGNFAQLALGGDDSGTVGDAVNEAIDKGRWALVLNGHFDVQYLSILENRLRSLRVNPSFRLMMTSDSPDIPWYFLENSLRFLGTNAGDAQRIFVEAMWIVGNHLDSVDSKQDKTIRSLLFRLATIHALLNFRRNTGMADFNHQYHFTITDLERAIRTLLAISKQEKISTRRLHLIGDMVYGSQISDTNDRRLLHGIFSDIINAQFHPDDTSYLSWLQPAYEMMQKGDVEGCVGCVRRVKNEAMMRPSVFDLNDAMILYRNYATSGCIRVGLERFRGDLKPESPVVDFGTMLGVVGDLRRRLDAVTEESVLDRNHEDVEVIASPKMVGKHFEKLLLDNIHSYKNLVRYILDDLSAIEAQLKGESLLSEREWQIIKQIHKDAVPKSWVVETQCYKSALGFSDWTNDLLERLNYIKNWHHVRFEDDNSATRNLSIHDISKLFSPSALLQVIINDHITTQKDNETIELMGLIVGAKQMAPPTTGCYVSGLSLMGAAWDKGHNTLKECKVGELFTDVACIWIQPVIRTASKRNAHKLKCPVYIFKPTSRYTAANAEELCIGHVDLPADSPKQWIQQGVCLVCEVPAELR